MTDLGAGRHGQEGSLAAPARVDGQQIESLNGGTGRQAPVVLCPTIN